jgi:endoglucanase
VSALPTATGPAARRRPVAGLVLLVVALVVALSSCAPPDTTLRPDPPRAMAPMAHPFSGARLAQDPTSDAAEWQADHDAGWLDPITAQPTAHWLTGPDSLATLPRVLRQARRQGAVPVLVVYDIPDRSCDPSRQGAASGKEYTAFVRDLVAALGRTRSVVILEPDILPSDCFGDAVAALLASTLHELRQAGHHVYLSAGPPGWRSPSATAERLLQAGVAEAEGFAVNVSGRASLTQSVDFAEQVAELVGGRDYLVDTGRAGSGTRSSANPAGVVADDWCNPPGQALGPRPSTAPDVPGARHLAATLWIKPPGLSDGSSAAGRADCHGETVPAGHFSPTQARALIAGAERTTPHEVRAEPAPDVTGGQGLTADVAPAPAPAVGGAAQPAPRQGVETGGGSTAGVEDVALFSAGGGVVLAGCGLLLAARRRRGRS